MASPKFARREFLEKSLALTAAAAGAQLQAQPQAAGAGALFEGFRSSKIQTSGATINVVSGGQGPPLLLLHGAPESHVMWHKLAPRFAREFTVVAADLRGYGDSSKPADAENHASRSKRAMAQDQVEVMSRLGFEKFAVVGHDRGGRVAHRLALDHPDRVTRLAVLDIVPTHKLYHNVTREFATAYYHWFFLLQPAPFPETLIGNSVEFYMRNGLGRLQPRAVTPAAFAEYLRCFRDPATVHAMCEDYRAGASIDLAHDDADLSRKIACPLLVLWAERRPMHRLFDVLATWRERASQVSGKPLPGGHFLPEEAPEETFAELRPFLRA
jgi:haloacetate dehalogenase